MARRVASKVIVGREAEMERLVVALDGARAGEPSLVLVEGEAGIGKTRLVTEFARRAAASGARVAVGSCVELAEGRLPYAPIMQAVRDLLSGSDGSNVERAVGPDLGHVGWLIPELGAGRAAGGLRPAAGPGDSGVQASGPEEATAPAGGPGEFDQSALFGALLRLLGLPEGGPVVLIVEDLHWADRSTLDVLGFLVRAFRDEHSLVVVTCRSDMPLSSAVRHALVELDRSPRVDRIGLQGLQPADVRELLGNIAGESLGGEREESIIRRSQGNPLFAEELLAAGDGAGSEEMPSSLRELLLDRLRLLGDAARVVARSMAVVGRGCDEELLATVSDLPPGECLAGLREAIDQQVIVHPGDRDPARYWFRHDLLAEAMRADLLPGERHRLHQAIALALQQRGGASGVPAAVAAAEVAHHWREAGRPAEALQSAMAAASAAHGVSAFAESARQLAVAAELWPQVPDPGDIVNLDRPALMERLAAAWYEAGEFDRAVDVAQTALREMGEGNDPRRRGILTQRLGSYLSSADRDAEALEAHQEAATLLADDPPLLARARAGIGATLMLLGHYQASVETCREAIRLAEAAGASEVAAAGRIFAGVDLVSLGRAADGIAELRQAIQTAGQAGPSETLLEGYHNLACMLELLDRLDESAATAMTGISLADTAGFDRRSGAGLQAVAGRALYRLGRWAEAEATFETGLALDPRGEHLLNLARNYGQLLVGLGRLEAGRRHLVVAATDARLDGLPELAVAQAEAALAEGDLDAARVVLDQALATLATTDDRLRTAILCVLAIRVEADRAELAMARRRAMELDLARALGARLYERAIAVASAIAGDEAGDLAGRIWVAKADAERSRLLANPTPGAWRSLATLLEGAGARPEVAYASFRQAEALLASRGSRREATDALSAAASIAGSVGAVPLLMQVEALARRGRLELDLAPPGLTQPVASDRATARGLGLTPREAEVLGLLATGRTNRQIAEALFITEKTASLHVSNILGKLEVTNRYDAAAVAERLGILPAQAGGPG
jgi:DNA-binding CsgD family transcriptional regulator